MGNTSAVWNHAKRVERDTAKCNLSDDILLAKGENTSVIERHLDDDKPTAAPPSIVNFLVHSSS